MNTPMRHLFSASTHVEERPAPPVHEPGTQPPEQERRLHLTRRQTVAVVVVIALIAAFGAIVLTQDDGGTPVAQPAPAAPAFGTVSTVLGSEANWALHDGAAGPDGSLYFASRGATNAINKLAPDGRLTTLRVPGTDLGPVAVARDGVIWTSIVTDNATSIVRLAGGGASPQLFQVPSVDLGATGKRTVFPIQAITVASDGSVWFQRGQINRWDSVGGYTSALGKVTPGGQMNIYPVGDRLYWPGGMVEGPDGSIWYSATCVCARNGFLLNTPANPTLDESGKLVPAGKYTLPTKAETATGTGPHPSRLTIVGGNLWFVEQADDYATELNPPASLTGSGAIGRLPLSNPSNDKIVEFKLPVDRSRPMGITLGSDGNLWVTEAGVNKLAQFNTEGKLLREYDVPGAPDDIVSGPDGNLYFTSGGAFEWRAQSHTDGLIGNQFPAWTVSPSTIHKFVVRS